MIGQSPQDFWNSSHSEIINAISGFGEFHGGSEKKKEEPMTSGRMSELMELYPD
jgi:hypothetical protein